jgi:3-hydroxyacyl-CoA dehydrogenase
MRLGVKTIAVIGANAVGRGVACAAADCGFSIVLEDVSDARLQQATAWIAERLASSTSGGAALGLISTAHTVEDAIRDADLIIETLPDEMEMQIELFTILDKFARPDAIFATTGLISITELAEVTFCADRCIGMRFGPSGVETKTVELVKGTETSRETIAACADVAQRMGKSVLVIDDVAVVANKSVGRERKFANAPD